MKKSLKFCLLLVLVITALMVTACASGKTAAEKSKPVAKSPLHKTIATEDVASVEVFSYLHRHATEDEQKTIIKSFNAATDTIEEKGQPAGTPTSGIVIKLKNQHRILILNKGDKILVQRDDVGKKAAYWATEEDLKSFLDDLAKEKS